jgi:GWxTD domain-containing protein
VRRSGTALFCAVGVAACGAARQPDSTPRPDPAAAISTLFDAAAVYGSMGLLVAGPPMPFVATVQYFADATADSTLALFALSLANHSLTFQREGRGYMAQYHVDVAFRGDSGAGPGFATDEAVRVGSFQETQRADESVIYQRFIGVPPGVYKVFVTVRDRRGPAAAHRERTDTVPRFTGQALSAPVAVYQAAGRARATEVPTLLVNPRATLSYGADSLRFYVEAYGIRPGSRLSARAVDQAGHEIWHDTLAVRGNEALATALAVLRPGELPVGEGRFEVLAVGAASVVPRTTRFLVSFSGQWAITNYDEMISLLRYFDRPDWVDRLRHATPEQRPEVWREFYKATDPVPITPENEALDRYFQRIQAANQRFREAGEPGWLTDRGEVLISLGEPDDVYEFSTEVSRAGTRGIRWSYNELRVTLFFQDQSGFGRFRLTPLSRAEFQRALAQVRARTR